MSMLLPHVCLKATMLYTCALMSSSRSFYHILGLMMLHHVTHHVTAMSHASSLSKRKEKENKIPIKSENKRKRNKNCSCPKCPITLSSLVIPTWYSIERFTALCDYWSLWLVVATTVMTIDIGYRSGNLILNASIRYNNFWIRI